MRMLTVICVFVTLVSSATAFQLTIVHTNDVHARFEEASDSGGKCRNASKIAGKCFGGVARRLTKIKELKATHGDNMVLLDAGDQYQGTLWFQVFKGHAAKYFMDALGYQAMAVGNHEFDLGLPGLLPLLENKTFPILSANIDASLEPSVNGKFIPSTVLTVDEEEIGVIGYTTTETPLISTTGKLIFNDEISAIQPIIDNMTTYGINKIILLGHVGYTRDQELAQGLRGVDVIVGGHSHTFLYTGTPPSDDKVIGPYPTIRTNLDGDKVLIVQDFFFGKYLGFLQVNFTADGKVDSWQGEPILLNSSVPQDPTLLAELEERKEQVLNVSREPVGSSRSGLEGRRTVCRLEECNLGNLVTDGMVWSITQIEPPTGTWTTAAIALMNSGGVRASIDEGEVTTEDVLTTMPFQNYIDVFMIKGRVLRKVLEHAVAKYDPEAPRGEFLQASVTVTPPTRTTRTTTSKSTPREFVGSRPCSPQGLQIVYNLKNEPGKRLVDVQVLCQNCLYPKYGPVVNDAIYRIIFPEFLANGGDGFDFELGPKDRLHLDYLDSDVFSSYIAKNSPVYSSVEGRIRFCGEDKSIYCPTDDVSSSTSLQYGLWSLTAVMVSMYSL